MRLLQTAVATMAMALGLVPAGCGGGGGGTPAGPVVGMGEQGAAMFADPRFKALGITHARLVVPYDAMRVGFERQLVDNWMGAARGAGVEPFITFGHSRVHPSKLPSVAEFRRDFDAFKARYPSVKVYAPWNEINHPSQPTHNHPERAAEYYNAMRADCAGCTVLAGDVLDQSDMATYLAEYRRHLKGTPTAWGLHNYSDTNRFQTKGIQAMLAAVRGDIWLTETGGIVRFGKGFPDDVQRAAKAVTYTFRLARATPRVKRVYLYNWTAAKPNEGFDSGLIGPDGTPRPGYDALKKLLGR